MEDFIPPEFKSSELYPLIINVSILASFCLLAICLKCSLKPKTDTQKFYIQEGYI